MTDFNPDLFAALDDKPRRMELATGAELMRGFALHQAGDIVAVCQEVVAAELCRWPHVIIVPGWRPESSLQNGEQSLFGN